MPNTRSTRSTYNSQASQAQTQTQQATPRAAAAGPSRAAKKKVSAKKKKTKHHKSNALVVDSDMLSDPTPATIQSTPFKRRRLEIGIEEDGHDSMTEADYYGTSTGLPEDDMDKLLQLVYNARLPTRVFKIALEAKKGNWEKQVLIDKLKEDATENEVSEEAEEDNNIEDGDGEVVSAEPSAAYRAKSAKLIEEKVAQVKKLKKEIQDLKSENKEDTANVRDALKQLKILLGEPMMTFIKDCVSLGKKAAKASVLDEFADDPAFQEGHSQLVKEMQMIMVPDAYTSSVARITAAAAGLTEGLRAGSVFDINTFLRGTVSRTVNMSHAETVATLILTSRQCADESEKLSMGSVKIDITLFTFVYEKYITRAVAALQEEVDTEYRTNTDVVDRMKALNRKKTEQEKAKLIKAQRYLREMEKGDRWIRVDLDEKVEFAMPKHRIKIYSKVKEYILAEAAEWPEHSEEKEEKYATISGGSFGKFWKQCLASVNRGYAYHRLSELTGATPERLAEIPNYYTYAKMSEDKITAVLDEIARQVNVASIVEIPEIPVIPVHEEDGGVGVDWTLSTWPDIYAEFQDFYGIDDEDHSYDVDTISVETIKRDLGELRKLPSRIKINDDEKDIIDQCIRLLQKAVTNKENEAIDRFIDL